MKDEILAELKMTLQCSEPLNFNKASLLQGVIMENISSDYADVLHNQGLKPYSQCVCIEGDLTIWYIRTLSLEACKMIIEPLMDDAFIEFDLRHNNQHVKIVDKELNYVSKDSLFKDFYSSDACRCFKIDFRTPTAFKKNGGYFNFPDIYNIFNSFMKRYDAVSINDSMCSEETLQQLVDNTSIVSYNLRSVNFSMEGIRVPAFMGHITIRINGPQTMVNFAKLLFTFGCYAGVGIKTAIGMGSVIITEEKRKVRE